MPLIIRKSDGGYGYATTDLATVRYRVATLRADRILYVVGAPQSLHFQMVWAAARLAGWLPDSVTTTHVQIGNVPGRTRSCCGPGRAPRSSSWAAPGGHRQGPRVCRPGSP